MKSIRAPSLSLAAAPTFAIIGADDGHSWRRPGSVRPTMPRAARRGPASVHCRRALSQYAIEASRCAYNIGDVGHTCPGDDHRNDRRI